MRVAYRGKYLTTKRSIGTYNSMACICLLFYHISAKINSKESGQCGRWREKDRKRRGVEKARGKERRHPQGAEEGTV